MALNKSRYIVGIDLGTTHTVVAYVDMDTASRQIQLFEIEQFVASGELKALPLLPSLRYHPAAGELPENQLQLPWLSLGSDDDPPPVFGHFARMLSAKVEGRSVVSAKSWLSHSGVDRSAAILPWGAAEGVAKVSPVAASASYLAYVRDAWNKQHADFPLQQQDVVLTVPASFDESARALTLKAARLAGLQQIRLLEEPQAVCYDWLHRNQQHLKQQLAGSRLLLVCDVGGGTTDLTLIKITHPEQGAPVLTRIGVGDHLMLGGDNIDLALAHLAEKQLLQANKKLNAASFSQLVQQCCVAKEHLLSNESLEKTTVTVLGSGSRLIGGATSLELHAEEVRQLVLEGFLPQVALDDKLKSKRSALLEFGLPYVADPAITRHIAAFLSRYQRASAEALGLGADEVAIPDALLLNGGMFNSPLLVQRLVEQLQHWKGAPVRVLENTHPDLAVALGAVASGLAQRGHETKIGGGSARSYFLVLDKEVAQGICLLPKNSEENHALSLDQQFLLRLGAPVQFELASSTLDAVYEPGQLVSFTDDNFPVLPPLMTVMKKRGSIQGDEARVRLSVMLTEIGTLEVQIVSVDDTGIRWLLEFDLRDDDDTPAQHSSHPRLAQARQLIENVYGPRTRTVESNAVKKLRNDLEKTLGSREQWDMPLLRDLSLSLLNGLKKRRRSQDHERVWFNLTGYCLRPGLGFPLDAWRIEQVKTLYREGLQYKKESIVWADWWNFWRRISGGLDTQTQEMIFDDIAPYLQPIPEKPKAHLEALKNKGYLALDDLLQLAVSLENIRLDKKNQLAQWLITRLEKSSESAQCWLALGRLGARVPLYGSSHNVLPLALVETSLEKILRLDWKTVIQAPLAAVTLARKSGDRQRDIHDHLRQQVSAKLTTHRAPQSWIHMVEDVIELNATDEKKIWGDALPPGIRLAQKN